MELDNSRSSSKTTLNSKKKTPAPRRFWAPQEEEALINAFKALRPTGWKCDGSFKGGYMVKLKSMMAEKFPNGGILTRHIKSKLQVWKKAYGHIVGILGSSGSTGAIWDPTTNMIVADSNSVWDEYIKIFGNDRVQGIGAVDLGDAVQELLYGGQSKEPERPTVNEVATHGSDTPTGLDDTFDDAASTTPPRSGTPRLRSTLSSKRKRNDSSTFDIDTLLDKFMENSSTALGALADKLSKTSNLDTVARRGLFEALSEIPGLTLD
ncbi:hypothetical protein CDL12_18273 [Handroanthus impetiginosus]|uniref:Myb/SANT-like domain-containing protein n=1 Tax=Handroanthus impetiginosus TaxID=429701 RepID=A0A2G9GV53_9LAMI|nr:hypothetical protein CDL12_18273 [Handroanthus impetiginosus]